MAGTGVTEIRNGAGWNREIGGLERIETDGCKEGRKE